VNFFRGRDKVISFLNIKKKQIKEEFSLKKKGTLNILYED